MITPVKTTLNAATYTAIPLDTSIRGLVNITCLTSDGSAFLISDTSAGTVNITIPANATFNDTNINTDTPNLYVKASAGTPDLYTLTSLVK